MLAVLGLVCLCVKAALQGRIGSSPSEFWGPLAGILVVALIWLGTYSYVADAVLDDGDFLVVRYGQITERVPWAEVVEAQGSTMQGYPVTIRLARARSFGKLVTFYPRSHLRLIWKGSHPLAASLNERAREGQVRIRRPQVGARQSLTPPQ